MFGGDQKAGLFSGGSGAGLFGKNEKKDADSSQSSGFSLFGGAGQKPPTSIPEPKVDQSAKKNEGGLFGKQGNTNPAFNIGDSTMMNNKQNNKE